MGGSDVLTSLLPCNGMETGVGAIFSSLVSIPSQGEDPITSAGSGKQRPLLSETEPLTQKRISG